jgi:hypothetical protein
MAIYPVETPREAYAIARRTGNLALALQILSANDSEGWAIWMVKSLQPEYRHIDKYVLAALVLLAEVRCQVPSNVLVQGTAVLARDLFWEGQTKELSERAVKAITKGAGRLRLTAAKGPRVSILETLVRCPTEGQLQFNSEVVWPFIPDLKGHPGFD